VCRSKPAPATTDTDIPDPSGMSSQNRSSSETLFSHFNMVPNSPKSSAVISPLLIPGEIVTRSISPPYRLGGTCPFFRLGEGFGQLLDLAAIDFSKIGVDVGRIYRPGGYSLAQHYSEGRRISGGAIIVGSKTNLLIDRKGAYRAFPTTRFYKLECTDDCHELPFRLDDTHGKSGREASRLPHVEGIRYTLIPL